MPESFFGDLVETFDSIIRTNSKECRAFLPETAVSIFEFCLTIIRTDQKSITNPYTKAKALELMALFIQSDTKS